jgi:hypothetical protein
MRSISSRELDSYNMAFCPVMEVVAKGQLIVGIVDSQWILELLLDKDCILLNCTHCQIVCLQHVDRMHSEENIQEM